MLRRLLVLMGILFLFTFNTPAKAVSWALYGAPCEAREFEPEAKAPAGAYGHFYFAANDLAPCPNPEVELIASGSELLRYFTSPGPAPFDGTDCPLEMDCGMELEAVEPPWIAVVDWDNWHGKSMQSMVKRSSHTDVETVLLALECAIQPCLGVSDLELLAVLAQLAQAIDVDNVPPPLAINMSFGRLQQTDDAEQANCQPSSLSCQIRGLLQYLTRPAPDLPPRTLAVAAAGNHMQPLFPASLDLVLSVGSLDLRSFALSGKVQASWETPDLPGFLDALMPGTALCLELSSKGANFQTPAPAGSSFATALLTGWLAELFFKRTDEVVYHLDLGGGLWQPVRNCTLSSCPFLLTHQGLQFPSSTGNASDRIYEAFENDPTSCGAVRGIELSATLIPVHADDDPLSRRSLIQEMAHHHRPAPETNPCVPCVCCQVFSQHLVSFAPTSRARAMARTVPFETEIDLHSAWKLPPEAELLGLYLLLGQDFKQLHFETEDALKLIATGEVAYLEISGTLTAGQMDEQPSLISLLRLEVPGLSEPLEVWDSTQLIWPLSPMVGQP